MLALQPILHVIGLLVSGLGLMMLVPALIDVAAGNPDWQVFAGSAVATWTFGSLLAVATRRPGQMRLNVRQAFLMTTLCWIAVAAFSALPFLGLGIGYTDAFFEAMSGITTTGATVLTNLENTAPGVLFWRALLQWMGGAGIVVMAIFILPFLRVGGMQLFQTESSERSEKEVARAVDLTGYIVGIYVGLTVACAIAYRVAGMSGFDAVTHSFTTVATGGYANYDASFAQFGASIQWIAVFFMMTGAYPFLAYIRMVRGQPLSLWRDPQARTLTVFVLLICLGMGLWLALTHDMPLADGLRLAFFNVVSIVTTTGYSSDDFSAWGAFAVGAFLLLMFIGGCTGSTSGSIKIYRFQVLRILIRAHLKGLARPSRVVGLTYHGRHLPADVPASVLAFVAVFLGSIALLTLALAAMGLDLVTALSSAAAAITNVGPGLGPIVGPAGNFSTLPDAAKWMLAFGMLVGRLELFTVLVLLDPDFWRS